MVKEIKHKRCISLFNQLLDNAPRVISSSGNIYFYDIKYPTNDILLFYYVGKTRKFFINIGIIFEHNLHFDLDDKTLISFIHDKYKYLNYDKITVYNYCPIKRYKIIDGLIKW